MTSSESWYVVLGVAPDSTPEQVRSAYRASARGAHPDIRGGDEEAIKRLNQAYDVLRDPVRRAQYDAECASAESAFAADDGGPSDLEAHDNDSSDNPPPMDDWGHEAPGVTPPTHASEPPQWRYPPPANQPSPFETPQPSWGQPPPLADSWTRSRRGPHGFARVCAVALVVYSALPVIAIVVSSAVFHQGTSDMTAGLVNFAIAWLVCGLVARWRLLKPRIPVTYCLLVGLLTFTVLGTTLTNPSTNAVTGVAVGLWLLLYVTTVESWRRQRLAARWAPRG